MSISLSSTVEDILNLKKNEIQSFLRSVNAKLTGTKHELAQRAYEKLSQVRREGVLVENDGYQWLAMQKMQQSVLQMSTPLHLRNSQQGGLVI